MPLKIARGQRNRSGSCKVIFHALRSNVWRERPRSCSSSTKDCDEQAGDKDEGADWCFGNRGNPREILQDEVLQ